MSKRILVVEDSITSRTLLKNILESVYYEVTAVATFAEGRAKLREEPINLMIIDIREESANEGFNFITKIRSSEVERIANLPMVILTDLESRQD
jgi:two-component system chemotaxis sensor kinase CheA